MVQTRRQENARKMDRRLQNVEQQLSKVGDLQETVLGFQKEMQMMRRSFCQKLQTIAQGMSDITNDSPYHNGYQRNNENADDRRRTQLPIMEFPRYEKPMTELTHLKQMGSLAEFNIKFDAISARLDLPEMYLVDAYVGALKEEIADSFRLFNPRTLVEAQHMARVQEISLLWRSKKKTVLSIENGLQGKFPESQEPAVMQEGCDSNFKTGQDSFIGTESSLTFNFKIQGLVADGGAGSSSSLSTEVESMEITSGVNRSWHFDSVGGVSKTIIPVSSSVLLSTGSVSSLPLHVASVLTRDNAKITSDADRSLIFGFAEELQGLFYHGDRCEIRKQTPIDNGSQLVICRVIGFPNFLISSTIQPAATTIPSYIGLQLATIFKWQKYYGCPLNVVIPYGCMGLEGGSEEENPIELQLSFSIPLGAIDYGLFQKWALFLNFSPTRILILEWFKGELITMLFGRVYSLSRKKSMQCRNQIQSARSKSQRLLHRLVEAFVKISLCFAFRFVFFDLA